MTSVGRVGPGLFALLCAVPLSAAEPDDVLALVPPKAVAVVHVRGIDRVHGRLDDLIKSAVPDRADQWAKSVRDFLAEALEGRDPKSLRPDGRLIIAISDLEKLPDAATLTLLLPVKSADDFRTGFLTADERKTLKKDGELEVVKLEDRPEPYYLVGLPGYMAACTDRDTARRYAAGEIGGIRARLSPETAAAFLDADVSLYVNVREVNARYGAQFKTYKSLADVFLRGDAVQGVNKAQMDQVKAAIDAAFRVLEDGTGAVLAVQFRPDGAALTGVAQFAEKSATGDAVKNYRSAVLKELGSLPTGQTAYSASLLGQAGWRSETLLLGEFSVADDDAAAKETAAGLQRAFAGYHRGVVFAAGNPFGPGGLEVIESKDAARIVAGRLGFLKAMTAGSFAHVPLKEKPAVRENAEVVGGFALHEVRIKPDFDKAVDDLDDGGKEAARNALRKSVGGDELGLWFGTDGKAVLQLTARDWAEAKGLAAAYLDATRALDKDGGFQFVRKQLPAEATMLAVLDAVRTTRSLFDLPAESPDKPAYVGFALVLKAGHGRFDLFVPAPAIGQIQKLTQPLLDKKPGPG